MRRTVPAFLLPAVAPRALAVPCALVALTGLPLGAAQAADGLVPPVRLSQASPDTVPASTSGSMVGSPGAEGGASVPDTAPPHRRAVEPRPPVQRPLWEFGLGAGVLNMPHYRGSDQTHTWLLPVPYFIYRGEILKADRDGARAKLLDTRLLEFDLSVAVGPPTRSDDNDARQGMDDLAPTIEVGPKLNWTFIERGPWRLQFQGPVRAAFTLERSPRSIGWLASPHVNLDYRRRDGWNFGLRAGLTYGDRRFHGYFYEVRPEDATPGRTAYRPGAGYGGQQYFVAMSRRFERFWLGAFAGYDTVRGAHFEDSPLVRRRDNVAVGVAMSWIFATSAQQVSVRE